jgi:type I restriction enzyme S subunit
MTEWRLRPISDLCTHIVDCVNKTAPISDDVTPFKMLRTTNVRDGWIDTSNTRRVDKAVYERWTRRMRPQRGNVILTREAPLGEVGMLRTDEPVFLGQRLVMYRADAAECDPHFLLYSLLGPIVQAELRSLGSGATVEHLRVPDCEQLTIPCPELPTQQRVGAVLSALDALIENNSRRIELLEEMAAAIYREWFVHFRYPGHENAALVDSPLGTVPAGWQAAPLVEGARIVMGQSPKSEFYNADGVGTPFHQGVTDFGRHFPTTRKYCTVFGRSAAEGDILVSVRAPVGRLNIADTDLVIGRGLAAIRALDGRQGLLFAHLRSVFAEEDSMGGGTIFKAIGKEELSQVRVLQVPEEIAHVANGVLSAQFDMIRALTFTNRHLAAMRDLLLPKLVTGQIDVSSLDLDALVGESVA